MQTCIAVFFPDDVTVILSLTCCCSFDEVGVTDATVVLLLTSLLRTVSATCVPLFWDAVRRFVNMERLREGLTLLTWAVYFPPPALDETAVSTRVFIIMSGMIGLSDPSPPCPRCGGPTVFVADASMAFGWRYRCGRGRQRVSRKEARKRHSGSTRMCSGYVSATTNTWFAGCRHLYKSLSLLFCWLARLPVTVASDAAQCGRHMAVDHYSMAREVCEVIMGNEVLSHPFGGPGVEVEVDECFLTRRKYHKGADFLCLRA